MEVLQFMLKWCFLMLDSGSAFLEEEYSRSDVFSVRPARRHLLLISSVIDCADLDPWGGVCSFLYCKVIGGEIPALWGLEVLNL